MAEPRISWACRRAAQPTQQRVIANWKCWMR
ncbi:hypothetical protein E2320_016411, partial [Naja naja]